MGVSTNVIGFKPADEKWRKMKDVWDSCIKAEIEIPKHVAQFFQYASPDDNGVEVDLETDACCKEWHADMQDGYEIDVSKLPKDVKIIRVYASY